MCRYVPAVNTYYGLRSYGTEPQVWGGDKECKHEWKSEAGRIGGGPQGTTGQRATRTFTSTGTTTHDTCSLCGCWRGELGQEPTLSLYLDHLLMVFDAVRRVLKDDGCLFVNLADSYDKNKSLYLMPAQFALLMKARGWIVRNDLVWAKTACMPESVTDRATRSHEYIFHFAKSARYFYDAEAVKEPHKRLWDASNGGTFGPRTEGGGKQRVLGGTKDHKGDYPLPDESGANQRTVWHIGPEPLKDEHYAAWPTEIPRRCILAGSSEKGQCPACGKAWTRVVTDRPYPAELANAKKAHGGIGNNLGGGRHQKWMDENPRQTTGWQPSCSCDADDPVPQTVLDPFSGSGRTGIVADRLGRNYIGIELAEKNVQMSERLIRGDSPMFAQVEVA